MSYAGTSAPSQTVPLIRIADGAAKAGEHVHSVLKIGNNLLKIYNGSQAFRRYNWLLNRPRLNAANNFRGMVVNVERKAAYLVNVENAEKLSKYDRYLMYASVAVEFARSMQEAQFTSDPLVNLQLLSANAESAMLRAVAGTVTGPAHLVTSGLLAASGAVGVGTGVTKTLDRSVVRMQSTVDKMISPAAISGYYDDIAHLIITTVTPR